MQSLLAYEEDIYDTDETLVNDKHLKTPSDTSILWYAKKVTFDPNIKDPVHNSLVKSMEAYPHEKRKHKLSQVKFPSFQKIHWPGIMRSSRLAKNAHNLKDSVVYGTFVFLAIAFSVVTAFNNNKSYLRTVINRVDAL